MHDVVLLLHLLAATVWTGGHLVLALSVLPRAISRKSAADLLGFEAVYERVGMPALVILVATGIWLAYGLVPDVGQWFAFTDPVARLVGAKLILLLLTLALAIHARLRLVPKLTEASLVPMAWHIIPVTVISVLFVVVGLSFRTGWFY
ncbi:MAG: copper resistance protein CopD [Rhodospirillales bacterium]|nr:MAG: copper resistance protein CopD [Rhodospirillales bacterium]